MGLGFGFQINVDNVKQFALLKNQGFFCFLCCPAIGEAQLQKELGEQDVKNILCTAAGENGLTWRLW